MKGRRLRLLGLLLLAGLVLTGFAAAKVQTTSSAPRTLAASNCQLKSPNGKIKHVVFIIFDNVHFLRDNPNVPSDVEQMPHLLNFIRGNGTLMTNDHTVLISHTANGILTNLTGMYSDRHGQAVSNSYRYFRADGSTASSSSFKYWTDLTDDVSAVPTDPTPVMVNGDSGSPKNTPAPWVPYTRAGCDFGATALANVVLENTGTGPNGDMTKVFGSGSTEWNEAVASNAAPPGSAARNLAQTDFVGIAVHCGAGGGICAGNPNARPDLLPDEPGGYSGFQGLFGAKYVNPAINVGSATIPNLNGTSITDQFGQPGFPGFDGLFASTTLSYVAQMQEAGIPITYGYISDAHDQHGVAGEIHATRGPGEADYVQQLKAYDDAFAKFFARLEADGINKSNTLFAFTVEEGDHFAGSKPTNPNCDGVNVPCTYSLVGEVNGNLAGLMAQDGVSTPFTVHADMAPTIYITGNPARDAPVTRTFGRTLAKLNRVNPYTGQPEDLSAAVADPVGMKALHMVTADPQRTPTLTMFAQPDWFFFTGAPNCNTPCVTVPTTPPTSTFAWNHGGIQPEIATTWLGLVGPGVRNNGDDATWADHTDVRPTMLDLVGLGDSYVHDGRVLIDQLDASAVPQSLRAHRETLRRLGDAYKQLNAPFGAFSMSVLKASTQAIKSGSDTNDSTYETVEGRIGALTSRRDALASQIRAALDGAAFGGDSLNEGRAKGWIDQADNLIDQAVNLGG
jgi:outer membrane murein-binding lipoprotein Lpp